MDEKLIRQIQREGAEALLDAGVSLPLKDFKIPFRRKPLQLRLTMRRPTLARQIKIARTYLQMETTADELAAMPHAEQLRWLVKHGRRLSRLIALTVENRWLPTRMMSWLIRHGVKHEYQLAAVTRFVGLMGTDPFLPIIRSAEIANPMRLRLSRRKTGS